MYRILGAGIGFIALTTALFSFGSHRKGATVPPVTNPAPTATSTTPTTTFEQVAPGDYTVSVVTPDSLTRTYIVHVPTGYTPSKAYPVLFGFHGAGGTADTFAVTTNFSKLADQYGFIAVFCQGSSWAPAKAPVWNAGDCCGQAADAKKNVDDVGFFRLVLQRVKSQYNVDASRVYVAGMSNGSMLSNRLACEASDLIAGAALVSGTIQVKSCTPARHIPILIIHGTADATVPYAGGKGGGAATNATFVPVETAFEQWGKQNGCTGAISTTPVAGVGANGAHTVDILSFASCVQQTLLYRINGGEHEWSGGWKQSNSAQAAQSLSASDTIVTFFKLK